MESIDKDQVIASLMESNEILRYEMQQLRNNNRILRRVHSALRSANQALRNQVALAQQNDELFKELCTEGSYGKVASDMPSES
jgi:regulator of replication initiation timing